MGRIVDVVVNPRHFGDEIVVLIGYVIIVLIVQLQYLFFDVFPPLEEIEHSRDCRLRRIEFSYRRSDDVDRLHNLTALLIDSGELLLEHFLEEMVLVEIVPLNHRQKHFLVGLISIQRRTLLDVHLPLPNI